LKHKSNGFIYPLSVEEMAKVLKTICDNYHDGSINYIQFEADLRNLMYKRNHLFVSAITKRWIGIKRIQLIYMVLGQIQVAFTDT
jgi:hypothetical protein